MLKQCQTGMSQKMETSETQAKVARIYREVWEISWDLTQSQEHSGESRKPLRHFYSPSLSSNQLSIRLEDSACVLLWDTGPCLPNMSVLIHQRRRQWHPTPVLLPGKSRGWRSLEGCSPWGRTEQDTTERLHFHFSLSCIGEGNGIPLQCSCLENPRDRGVWWAAVYGVTQSRTRLKRLRSSSIGYMNT